MSDWIKLLYHLEEMDRILRNTGDEALFTRETYYDLKNGVEEGLPQLQKMLKKCRLRVELGID
jgi:hypothetical protein